MVNNTAIAIVILNIGNLLVYFMFSGSRTKQARYSSLRNFRMYSVRILFFRAVHFTGSPFGESID